MNNEISKCSLALTTNYRFSRINYKSIPVRDPRMVYLTVFSKKRPGFLDRIKHKVRRKKRVIEQSIDYYFKKGGK